MPATDRPTPAPGRVHPSPLGATWRPGDATTFRVWAPDAERVEVLLGVPGGDPHAPRERTVTLAATAGGYHVAEVAEVPPGTAYAYRLHRPDGPALDRPDPAARWQPGGVHGASAVDAPPVDARAAGFAPPPLHRQVLYELHVGAFTAQGTFDGVVSRLDELAALGITTLELLPVAQFPGERNWGYDGVLPYAVQDSYGGPAGLRRLVDAAHARGLAVVLDVVYNHLGPEGNYLADFGPYFTDRYATPWGPALNVDGPGSDAVRHYLVDGARRWVTDFDIDGLRLDAVHAIPDQSAVHLLEELAAAVHAAGEQRGAPVHVVAESDLSDPRLVRHPEAGGLGLDGQWADEFHHAIHVALTDEREGYYADFVGLGDLARQVRDRYAYAGRYSPARERTVGRPAPDVPYDRFVTCVQNHDQVGNRMLGERLGALTDLEGTKLAAAALLTAPFVPLLFMGEEYGEPAPFLYFTSHGDPELATAVTRGRRAEFAAFSWQGSAPDPQAEETFTRSRLDPTLRDRPGHRDIHALYRHLIALRRDEPLITDPTAPDVEPRLEPGGRTLVLRRRTGDRGLLTVINAHDADVTVRVPDAPGPWRTLVDTAHERWAGPGAAPRPTLEDDTLHLPVRRHAVRLLRREEEPDA